MTDNKHCPCCGRHCDLNSPHCERGWEYLRTGEVPSHSHTPDNPRLPRRPENYNTSDTGNKLIINLRDLGHILRFLFEGRGSQKRILIILLESGTMTQRELTERLDIKPGSASEVIGKLENAGMIQRIPSKEDRRTMDIQLTEAGRIHAEEASRQRFTRHQEMFSCLSPDEQETLLALLEKLTEDWNTRYRELENRQGHHGHHSYHGEHPDKKYFSSDGHGNHSVPHHH